ncbi:MAG TPA: YbaK/EbsC family protein [bacterium]|nr:YbaK/EbsC family protein [bacterium]HPL95818.1 YbaK/EbsC family protein [bacterium]
MNKKLLKNLEESKLKFELIKHRKVFTAHDAAATMHVKLNTIAKSLLVKTNKPLEHGKKPYAIVIVPADKNIDLKKLAKVMTTKDLRITKVDIPKEGVMKSQFKVKPGAMGAFGTLYKLAVFVDKALKNEAVFSAGAFDESIKIKVGDFIKLENAKIGNFSVAKKIKKNKKKK